MGDIGSCNGKEVNRPKTPAYQANPGLQKCFSWSHLVKKMILCGTAMILWWINECDWSVVKSVDRNCPPLKFVGLHGVSYFGHKRPKMLKNSELQASRVATSLGQCGHIDTSTTLSLSLLIFHLDGLLILFCIYCVHLLYLGMVSKKSKNDNEEESQVLRCFFKMYFRLPLFVVWVKRCQVVCRRQIRTTWNLGSSYQRLVSTEQSSAQHCSVSIAILTVFFRGAGSWLSWLQSWMQTWPEKRAWLCYVGYRGETRWLADRKWQYAPRRVEVRSAVIERQLIGYIPEKGTQVITKWSPSGQQVVTKWSPSVYLVVTMWSTCGHQVVTKWSWWVP